MFVIREVFMLLMKKKIREMDDITVHINLKKNVLTSAQQEEFLRISPVN